jgi:hypothetical protein
MKKKIFFIMVAIMMVAVSGVFGQKKYQSISLGPVFSIAPKSFGLLPTPIESIGFMVGVNNVFFDNTSIWASVSPPLDFIKKFPFTEDYKIGIEYNLGKEWKSNFKCSVGGILGYSRYSGFTMMTGEDAFKSLKNQSLKIGPSFLASYDFDHSVLERLKFFFRLDAHLDFLNPAIKESGWLGAMVGLEFTPKLFSW